MQGNGNTEKVTTVCIIEKMPYINLLYFILKNYFTNFIS